MSRSTLHILSAPTALALLAFMSPARAAGDIDCELGFDLAGWSVF